MTGQERLALAREIAATLDERMGAHACACGSTGEKTTERITSPPTQAASQPSLSSIDVGLTDLRMGRVAVQDALSARANARYRSVLVESTWVSTAVRVLEGSATLVNGLVGYPNGTTLTPVKCQETEVLLRLGVDEITAVADIDALHAGDLDSMFVDLRALVDLARCRSVPVSVVFAFEGLPELAVIQGCAVAKLAGARAVVASPAWNRPGLDLSSIPLMRRAIGGDLDVVASGGIEVRDHAVAAFAAGATRVVAAKSF